MILHHPPDIAKAFLRADGYQRGSYEMAVNLCGERRRIGVAMDLGAHIGTWAMRLEKRFSKVVAIEANEEWLPWLRKNAPRATVIHAFVNGEKTLDGLWEGPVDFLKIDTDSILEPILEGAGRILREHRPVVCAEMVHNDVFDLDGYRAMQRLGYIETAHYNKDYMFVDSNDPDIRSAMVLGIDERSVMVMDKV